MKKGWGLQNSRSRMIALFIVDMLAVILDSYLAIILRFKLDNIWVPEEYMSSVEHYMIINVITTVIIFLLLNLYNRVWSYASLYEMLLIVCAAMLSTAFQAFGFSLLYLPIPRSYYFFYFILLSITTLITRFSYRILHTMQNGIKKSAKHSRNTIVIGAGEAGNMIIKELKSSKYLNQKVVCVIDDNPSKKGKYIHGIRIVGGRDMIQEAAKKYDAEDLYVIGGDSIYKQFLPYCDKAHVTKIDFAYEADAFFPNLDEMPEWKVTERSEEQTYFDIEYEFLTYEKK